MKTTTNHNTVREQEGQLLQAVRQPHLNASAAHRAGEGRDRITCINDERRAHKALVPNSRKHARKCHIEYIDDGWPLPDQECRKAHNRSELITAAVRNTNLIGIRQMSGEAARAVCHGAVIAAVDQKCDFGHLFLLASTFSYIRMVSCATESHPWCSTAPRAPSANMRQLS